MTQLSVPLPERLDTQLAGICNRTPDPSTLVPVLIRCSRESIPKLRIAIREAGGSLRHTFEIVDAVSAWIPKSELGGGSLLKGIEMLELEEPFRMT